MRYIKPTRVKFLMIMFFTTGMFGIIIGLSGFTPPSFKMIITFMGVVNLGLGAFFTFIFLTQTQKDPDKRKKKRKTN